MSRIINYKVVFRVLSTNLFILAGALFACAGIAVWFSEATMPFLFSSFISMALGGLLFLTNGKQAEDPAIHRKDSYLIVTLSWLSMSLVGCMPYLFSGAIPSPVNAFFESMSGFSTTGASILVDVEILPKSILFWRSLTHWIGGIGIIVLVIIVMPALQMGSYQLFTLESSLQEKIQPKIKDVGIRLLAIYLLLTFAEILFLMAGNMNLFESVCHSFGTVATGGFSPKNSSIIAYSPYIQYVITIFMFLAGTNFIIYYHLYKREFQKVKENEELKFYILVVFTIVAILTASLFLTMHKPLEQAFRDSFFQVVSIVTCTGFASADYLLWPSFAWTIIFFSMFLGGSTGSTAGGIKMARHIILIKNIGRFFSQIVSPHAVLPIRLNKNTLSDETNRSILTFIAVYFTVFLIGTLSLVGLGIDGKTSSSSVATCMAGIGPGIGTVGPVSNFAHLPDAGKIILSIMMLLGRLEIYTVIVMFTRNFWSR